MNTKLPDLSGLPHVRIATSDLRDLLPRTHTAVSCNSSTAALESFIYGVKTISYVDPEALNSSPLRGVSGAMFVTSSEQLDVALTENRLRQSTEPITFDSRPMRHLVGKRFLLNLR